MTEIQSSANDLVISTEQELKQVSEGVELGNVTGDSLEQILDMIEQTATTLDPRSHRALVESRSLTDQCAREVRTFAYLLHGLDYDRKVIDLYAPGHDAEVKRALARWTIAQSKRFNKVANFPNQRNAHCNSRA